MKVAVDTKFTLGGEATMAKASQTYYRNRGDYDEPVKVDGAEFEHMLTTALKWYGHTTTRGLNGTYIIRSGSNTIQLWEQVYETDGGDTFWWMQVRGPAFEDYPRASYRLTQNLLNEALRSM